MRVGVVFGGACIALGLGVAANSLLGPIGLGVIEYRTPSVGLDQLKGADIASLAVVAPSSLVAGWLWWRGHAVAPMVSLATGAYAAYTFTQAILGIDYGLYEGNNERFFPLHLALAVVGGTIALRSWSAVDQDSLPPLPSRLRKTAAFTMLGSAAFLALGLHLPTLIAVWRGDPPAEYIEIPAAFWVVKLMDLGLIVPAAAAAGVGLLRGSRVAQRATYGLVGVFAMIAASVTSMAAVLMVNDDPSASLVFTVGFGAITTAFAVLAYHLARAAVPRAVEHRESSSTTPRRSGDARRRGV